MNEQPVLVADLCLCTRALGPGRRAVVWVQGCPFRCSRCIAPEWIPVRGGRAVLPEDLARRLLTDPRVTGLTLSGGEPMLQAAGLARTVAAARRQRDLDVICFTGFTLERLRERPPSPGAGELLAAVDVLIDGQYVEALNDGKGLRGSSNQVVHHLTGRLREHDLTTGPRRTEVLLGPAGLGLIGVPPPGLLAGARDLTRPSPAGSTALSATGSTGTSPAGVTKSSGGPGPSASAGIAEREGDRS